MVDINVDIKIEIEEVINREEINKVVNSKKVLQFNKTPMFRRANNKINKVIWDSNKIVDNTDKIDNLTKRIITIDSKEAIIKTWTNSIEEDLITTDKEDKDNKGKAKAKLECNRIITTIDKTSKVINNSHANNSNTHKKRHLKVVNSMEMPNKEQSPKMW